MPLFEKSGSKTFHARLRKLGAKNEDRGCAAQG